jgi:hypothetical protein
VGGARGDRHRGRGRADRRLVSFVMRRPAAAPPPAAPA